LLCALLAAHLYGATLLVDTPYPLEALSSQLPLWAALAACLAVAYSWLFTALSARTPGMALAGQRLETLRGGAPGLAAALVRALLSLLSAPGVFGFLLALFDSRGQTLHDKLCGCVVVISPPDA
ncbi:MAG TPA: RDD family protein, partial [Myxococcales bacterium]